MFSSILPLLFNDSVQWMILCVKNILHPTQIADMTVLAAFANIPSEDRAFAWGRYLKRRSWSPTSVYNKLKGFATLL